MKNTEPQTQNQGFLFQFITSAITPGITFTWIFVIIAQKHFRTFLIFVFFLFSFCFLYLRSTTRSHCCDARRFCCSSASFVCTHLFDEGSQVSLKKHPQLSPTPSSFRIHMIFMFIIAAALYAVIIWYFSMMEEMKGAQKQKETQKNKDNNTKQDGEEEKEKKEEQKEEQKEEKDKREKVKQVKKKSKKDD